MEALGHPPRSVRDLWDPRLRGRVGMMSDLLELGSFGLLTLALKKLDVGPAYAVWTGIGAAGTAIYGMVFLGDLVSTLKIVSITFVIVGVIGLQLSGSAH